MNYSPTPKTPIRTPQPGSSNKTIQLTPIWQEVVKNQRLPPDSNENLIFKEISSRLEDPEWPVRQHAFRVLFDVIPVIPKDRLDERIIQNDILVKLVMNLGHSAPGVRKVALETIRQYLKQSKYSEKMLENFVEYGVKEEGGFNSERTGIARENITLGTIISLVEILKPFIFPENGGYAISQQFLNKLIEILSSKLNHPLYEEKCRESLWKIREMVGEARFSRAVDKISDKNLKDFLNGKEVKKDAINLEDSGIDLKINNSPKKNEENSWSDETKSDNSYGEPPAEKNQDSDQSCDIVEMPNSITTYHNYQMLGIKKDKQPQLTNWDAIDQSFKKKESSDEFSDGTDTDTYTKEPAPENLEDIEEEIPAPQEDHKTENEEICKPPEEVKESNTDGNTSPSPRVVLETEIKFSEEKAIKMTIVEDEKDSEVKEHEIDLFPNDISDSSESSGERRFVTEDGDLIMKILHNNEDECPEEEERKRTPRRVRFGGEVIKLRTPDSDATDITIEIHEADDVQTHFITTNRPSTAHGKPDKKKLEVMPVQQKNEAKPKVERLVLNDSNGKVNSHIPVAISPGSKNPDFVRVRDVSPIKKSIVEGTKIPVVVKENAVGLNMEVAESLNSSSSSETDLKNKLNGVDESYSWKWTEFGYVDEEVLKDLRNKNDWKVQYQALEQLKTVLINPKTIERIKRSSDNAKLNSLFKFLLYKLPQGNNQQITTLSVSIVSQLLQTLPKEKILLNLEDIVKGLCKYVGGCKNVNLKIESVQSLKMLFGILEPSSVIDVLLGEECLSSPSSKLRENSLLAVMYATMTFPSNLFNVEKILEKVSSFAADSRRRVRHASLEAIAILSQFCSSETLTENIAKVAESLPNQNAKVGLISAVQARLSRRVLPTVSNEGLVLYALQIPASRRIGSVGNPMGADVDWILSGTGSVSTGSARSRGQLNAAQRLDVSPTKSFSSNKWSSSDRIAATPNGYFIHEESYHTEKSAAENPWTIQKNRTEQSGGKIPSVQENWKHGGGNRFYKTQSTGNLMNRKGGNVKFVSSENLAENQIVPTRNFRGRGWDSEKNFRINPEEVTWALVPVSTLEEAHLTRGKGNALWGELGIENGNQYFSSSFGAIRPLYLKLQPGHDQFSLSRSTDDLRRTSRGYTKRRVSEKFNDEEVSQIRVLTPSILRDRIKNDDSNSEVSGSSARTPKSDHRNHNENGSRIPNIHMGSSRGGKRIQKHVDSNGLDRKTLELEDSSSIQRSIIVNQSSANSLTTPPAAVFLPNIHSNHYEQNNDHKYVSSQKPPLQSRFSEIDEIKLQDTMTQLSGLLTTSKALSKSLPLTNRVGDIQPFHQNGKNQSVESEIILPIRTGNISKRSDDFGSSTTIAGSPAQTKLFDRSYKKINPTPNPVASAPAVINSDNRDPAPSTSSSNSTDLGLNGSEMKTNRLNNGSGALELSSSMSYRSLNNSFNQKVKAKRAALSKNCSNKVANNGNPFPDNLKPFDRPKEGIETCFNQLESQQWEVTMLGLTSLVRLLRHHPAMVLGQLHPIVVALGRHIKNLRSQVSRAACQTSAEMFVTLKRNLETDLEELAGPLFHRSADTNRFIRADCNHALDNMTDNISPARVVSVIIAKGASHQNATVRTVSARLLLRLSEKIGPEKVLSLPKEIRDKMLQVGANLLMEGKLETRAFAKELFRIWSLYPGFSSLILEAIPPNVMRHISKTLISLKS